MSGLESGRSLVEKSDKSSRESTSSLRHEPQSLSALPIEWRRRAYDEFLKEEPTGHDHARRAEYLLAGHVLIRNQEFSLAKNLLRELIQANSKDAQAIRAFAQCLRGQKNWSEAATLLKILVGMDDRPEHLIELADALYNLCEDAEALKYYLMALRSLGEEAIELFEVYKSIGNIFVRSHDFESAEENFNKAYTLRPDSSVLMVNFGTLEIQRGDLSRAAEHFRKAVDLDPSNDRAWVGLAIVHREFGDIELSWGNLERALDLNPANDTAIQLGLSWAIKDGKGLIMIGHLNNFLALNGEDASVSLALAQLLYILGRFLESRIEIERAIALDPQLPGATELLNLLRKEELK